MSRSLLLRSLLLAGALAASGCRDDLRQQEGSEKEGAAAPKLAAIGDQAVVSLDSATITRIGLKTLTLTRSTHPAELEFPAIVVEDPGAGTTIRAGVGGRLAMGEGGRWPTVGQQLDAGVEIAQVGDARPVAVPRAGTVTRLLAQPGELVQAGQPLVELVDYSSPLVRIAWTASQASPPSVQFRPLAGGAEVK